MIRKSAAAKKFYPTAQNGGSYVVIFHPSHNIAVGCGGAFL